MNTTPRIKPRITIRLPQPLLAKLKRQAHELGTTTGESYDNWSTRLSASANDTRIRVPESAEMRHDPSSNPGRACPTSRCEMGAVACS